MDTVVGTVRYMSPERLHGEAYGRPADVWGLGLVMIECVTQVCGVELEGGEGSRGAPLLHLACRISIKRWETPSVRVCDCSFRGERVIAVCPAGGFSCLQLKKVFVG